ncbi:MAG: PqqD family protein [Ruminococcaceae bacterium]|nr:PqqD family protein [Oscillospiraceae bacterium]
MKNKNENFVEKVPVLNQNINWSQDQNGVTLEIENNGVFNRIAQKLFKKPKISYIHLEEIGSFVWPLIDGEKDIFQIGKQVEEHFGEKAEPLYPRLVKYFEILESYKFITFK